MFIYGIQNKITGKWYIGQTMRTTNKRFIRHRYLLNKNKHPNKHLQSSVNKHGLDAFEFVSLGLAKHKIELNELEKCFISFYNSFDDGYNLTTGGDGNSGWTPSVEWRENMSKIKTGKQRGHHSKETKIKMSIAQKGKTLSQETKDKISKIRKEYWKNKKEQVQRIVLNAVCNQDVNLTLSIQEK